MKHFRTITLFILSFVAMQLLPLLSETAIAQELSPQMQKQIQNMSPSERRKMAERYGVDLGELEAGPREPAYQLGQPGVILTPPRRFDEIEQMTLPDEQQYMMERMLEEREFKEEIEEELKRFGEEFFVGEESIITQVDNLPVAEDYLIGVGDSFFINILGNNGFEGEVQVERNGSIFLPSIGSLKSWV